METIAKLNKWYKSELGSLISEIELEHLKPFLTRIFGDYILQIGGDPDRLLIKDSPIFHKIFLDTHALENQHAAAIQIDQNNLPLIPKSVDAIVMLHFLENSSNPKDLIAQVYQALKPNGTCILTGFNPFSLCGMMQLKKNKNYPWTSQFYSFWEIKRFFESAGFNITRHFTCFFRPVIQDRTLLHRLRFLEGVGQFCFSQFGGIHIIVARKKVIALTPLREKSFEKKLILNGSFVKPSTRSSS